MLNIVGVTKCTTGIAHTYIAKEKLVEAAEKAGHKIKIEADGWNGPDENLTELEIQEADVVILAVDVAIDKSRFKGKPIVEIPTSLVMKSAPSLISKIEEKLGNSKK